MLANCFEESNQIHQDVGSSVVENGHEYVYIPVNVCGNYVKSHHGVLKDGRLISSLKPIVILGHDECIFKQYQFTNKAWVSDKGTAFIIPNDDAIGIMISDFQSRECCSSNQDFTEEDLRKINQHRRLTHYLDQDAVRKVHGSLIRKKDLVHNPFCVYFEYDANRRGYLTYNHVVLQC